MMRAPRLWPLGVKPAGLAALALASVLWLGTVEAPAAQAPGAAASPASLGRASDNAGPEARNTRHALIIGVGRYSDPEVPTLHGVVHDLDSARRMARAMAVPDSRITVLHDGQATAARIRSELAALHARMADGDRVFIYYSGHGTRWFDPAAPADGCIEGLLAADGQVLSNQELGERLAPVARRADKMLVFYDACFSGGVAGAPLRTRSVGAAAGRITPKFTRAGAPEVCATPSNMRTRSLSGVMAQARALPQNLVHVAASRPDEASFDSADHGGFATVAWRDCLLGEARDLDGSGALTVEEITHCAQAKVTQGLAGHEGISGQQLTVAGNARFVPAWMKQGFDTPPAPAPTSPTGAVAGALAPPLASPTAPTITAPPAAPPLPVASPAPHAPAASATPPPGPPLAPSVPAPPGLPATPAQLLAEVHSQRHGLRAVQVRLQQPTLKIGVDALQMEITAERDGYLYLALAGSDGRSLYLLYPNELATDNRVRAGQPLALPGAGRWEIVAGGPAGTETLLVMVTDAPRDLRRLAQEKTGPFMKSLLDERGRTRLQEVLANGTPAPGCGQPGAAPCSDAFGAALLRVQSVP